MSAPFCWLWSSYFEGKRVKRSMWWELLSVAVHVLWDMNSEQVTRDFVLFRNKYNVVVLYVHFTWFTISFVSIVSLRQFFFFPFSYIVPHRWSIQTCKGTCFWPVFQRKKLACKLVAFLFLMYLMGAERLWQDGLVWMVREISIIVWSCQWNRSLFVC